MRFKQSVSPNAVLLWAIVLINICFALVFGFESSELTYDASQNKHLVRLFTTHFSHQSFFHLSSNMMALILLAYLMPSRPWQILLAGVFCVGMTGLFVWLNGTETFLGSSALLYCFPGLFISQAIISGNWQKAGCILLCLLVYLLWQNKSIINGPKDLQDTIWQPFVIAHILGFMSGILSGFISRKHITSTNPHNSNQPMPGKG